MERDAQRGQHGISMVFFSWYSAKARGHFCRRPTRPGGRTRSFSLTLKLGREPALFLKNQSKMQDHNHWYSLQRSNTDQNAYSIPDPVSNTSTLPTAGLHDNQPLPSAYSFASAVRPTQGERVSPSLDTVTHYIYYSVPSPFPSIHGRTHAFSPTAPIFQHEWLPLPFT
jgi:hypothetical protein